MCLQRERDGDGDENQDGKQEMTHSSEYSYDDTLFSSTHFAITLSN